jgi:putative transposase
MIPRDLLEDYLVDQEEGLKGLLTWFLNLRFRFSLWNHKSFPVSHQRRIRTTNGLERINKELKRRTRVVGAFPSEQSFMRLCVSILIDINEEWMTAKKYLTMDED